MTMDQHDHFKGSRLNTTAKLIILEDYLTPYVNIMKTYWDAFWYVDTHSGTGKTELSDGVIVDGSALIALSNHADDFERFYFYEVDDDSFTTLHRTIEDELGYRFEVSEAKPSGADFQVARCNDPYIKIMNTDSNQAVRFLAHESNDYPHWFTFVDPRGFGPTWDTLDTLIDRGNMDLLVNLQTTGIVRNTGEGADHSHGSVSSQLDTENWAYGLSEEEVVERYTERMAQNNEWNVISKDLRDPTADQWRFDLVFASDNDTARDIMDDIMNKNGLWEEAEERAGQSGLSGWT